MSSLGRPAEALILRYNQLEVKAIEGRENISLQQTPVSASELAERVEAESGVGARVAENLEEIRSSWASELPRNKKPTALEFHELEKRIDDGFTRQQLAEYYGQDKRSGPDDLSFSFSSELYTRSEWCPTITDFPGNAAQRLNQIQKSAGRRHDTSEAGDVGKPQEELNDAKKASLESKPSLINKILRRRWHIRTVDDEERLGQIDIWPRRAYLRLLLNHSEYYPTPILNSMA